MRTHRNHRARRVVQALAGLSLLLLLATLTTVRPVAAAGEFSTYSMTYSGAAAGRSGLVGASGGLVAFSGGPGAVTGRLDAAPSGSAEASSIEPGTMARLVAGQVNSGAGEEVVGEPLTARAAMPGSTSEDSATQAGPQEAGPLTVVGGEAVASVSSSAARSRAGVATFRVAGQGAAAAFTRAAAAWRTTHVDGDGGLAAAQQPRAADDDMLRIEGAHGDGRATADAAAQELASTVEVGADRVVVQGALVLEGIVGRATTRAAGAERTSTATLDIASATVGGVPVTIDETGVTITEEQVLTGGDVTEANAQLQEILTQAGISVRLLDTVETTEERSARASSGGVAVEVVTPSSAGVPRNVVGITVGRGQATLSAEPASDAALDLTPPPAETGTGSEDGEVAPPAAPAPDVPSGGAPSGSAPVDAPAPVAADEPAAPEVAAPRAGTDQAAPQQQLVAAGVAMSRRTAYAGFAAWMLFTSTLPLLGSWLLERRP